MSGKVRWAVLGPGAIAHRFAEALRGVPGAVLLAVGSRDAGRARAFADQYEAERAYGSYGELAADRDVDAVYVATPHTAHSEHAVLCLEHGKAVLCEKPLTVNAGLARRMIGAAHGNGAFLMEAMWTRFLPAVRHAKQLLEAGAVGEPRTLTADFSFSARPDPASRLFCPDLAGGGLLDVGVYALHLSALLFGPRPEAAWSDAVIGATGVDESAAMVLKHAGGRLCALTCGVRAQGPNTAVIAGTEGRIELSPFWRAESVRLVRGGETQDIPFPFFVNGFEYQIMEAMDCMRKGLIESPLLPHCESLAVLETMDGFRRQWGLVYPVETSPP